MSNNKHPAFSFAVLVSITGGAAYVLKGHLPSFVGGTALGLAFLTGGVLVTSGYMSDRQFQHSTSIGMSAIITTVTSNYALRTGRRLPVIAAGAGALCAGYHSQRLVHEVLKRRRQFAKITKK
ncbi:TPA: hypothetical protein N0F65_005965 [Lagenidium giganteum]|uniref:Transmembrane protein 14 n=1 Tax=Lagenidium giganteum TaxID=4803 RepID=A0AAV2Z6B7_9STRA|nr:TPA: hypothetical protein N0F65_005965 [Lagenidium giganteum]